MYTVTVYYIYTYTYTYIYTIYVPTHTNQEPTNTTQHATCTCGTCVICVYTKYVSTSHEDGMHAFALLRCLPWCVGYAVCCISISISISVHDATPRATKRKMTIPYNTKSLGIVVLRFVARGVAS